MSFKHEDVEKIFNKISSEKLKGKEASYIPFLMDIDPHIYAISICNVKGEIMKLGDYKKEVAIESASKVFSLALALEKHNIPYLLDKIGDKKEIHEFNSIYDVIHIPNHTINIEQAIRSVFICSTRTWNVGLVPWIDFFNHSYNGSALNNEATTITATHDYEQDEEVNTTYGLKDSLELLNTYGFCAKEKTIAIPFLSISSFCTALDPSLKEYRQFTEGNEFLVNKTLHNIDHLIAHFRLCVLDKKDVLFIDDIAKDFKVFINMNNEHRAIKLLLLCIKTLHEKIKKTKENLIQITGVLPDKHEEDINIKQEILKKLKEKIYVYWIKLLGDNPD